MMLHVFIPPSTGSRSEFRSAALGVLELVLADPYPSRERAGSAPRWHEQGEAASLRAGHGGSRRALHTLEDPPRHEDQFGFVLVAPEEGWCK